MMGIYRITNTVTQKVYIGRSKNIKKRLSEHQRALKNNKHPVKALQSDWNLYGEEAFIFEIIKTCSKKEISLAEKEALEQHRALDPEKGYNTYKGSHYAWNPDRHLVKPRTHIYKDPEPATHPTCETCEYSCKQYITAEILYCPKLRRK